MEGGLGFGLMNRVEAEFKQNVSNAFCPSSYKKARLADCWCKEDNTGRQNLVFHQEVSGLGTRQGGDFSDTCLHKDSFEKRNKPVWNL